MRFSAIFSAAFIFAPALAFAAGAPAQPKMPAPLENLGKSGAEIRYLGNEGGLDGWVTIKDGQEQYFYVTPDGQSIVLGVLFNNKGDIVTMRQVNELRKKEPGLDKIAGSQLPEAQNAVPPVQAVPASPNAPATEVKTAPPAPVSKSQLFYQAVENASWISLGRKDAPVVYSFIDPQCPHCHDMIQDVRKSGALEKGDLQLRLIPVGLMNETSLKQAANLIAAPNASDVLYKHLDGDKNVLVNLDANPNTQSIQRNMILMQDWKIDVTPFSLYKNKKGEIKILRGRPGDLKAVLKDLK